jgi:hypothetical protein
MACGEARRQAIEDNLKLNFEGVIQECSLI